MSIPRNIVMDLNNVVPMAKYTWTSDCLDYMDKYVMTLVSLYVLHPSFMHVEQQKVGKIDSLILGGWFNLTHVGPSATKILKL